MALRSRLRDNPALCGAKLTFLPFFLKVSVIPRLLCALPGHPWGVIELRGVAVPPSSCAPNAPPAQAAALALFEFPDVNSALSEDGGSLLRHG